MMIHTGESCTCDVCMASEELKLHLAAILEELRFDRAQAVDFLDAVFTMPDRLANIGELQNLPGAPKVKDSERKYLAALAPLVIGYRLGLKHAGGGQ